MCRQLIAVWWLVACSAGRSGSTVPAETAVVEVTTALDQAAERIRKHDPAARDAVIAAYQKFEQDLEPALRGRVPPVDLLSMEYAFGQLADAVQDPERAESTATLLKQRLQASISAKNP